MTVAVHLPDARLGGRAATHLAERLEAVRAKTVALAGLDQGLAARAVVVTDDPATAPAGALVVVLPGDEGPAVDAAARALVAALLAAGWNIGEERIPALLVDGINGLVGRALEPERAHPAPRPEGDIAALLGGPPEGFDRARFAAIATEFVDFLLQAHGADRLRAFAGALAHSAPDAAAAIAYGKGLAVLEQEWRDRAAAPAPARMGLGGFIARVLHYSRPSSGLYLFMLAMMSLQLAYLLFIPIGLRTLFDDGIVKGDGDVVTVTLGLLTLGFIGHAVSGFVQDWIAARIASRTLGDLRRTMYARLQELSDSYFVRAGSGAVVARFGTDLAAVETALTRGIPSLVLRMILMLGSIATAFALDWRMAIAAFVTLPIAFIAPRPLARRATEAAYERRGEDARLGGIVQETLSLSRIIRAFRLQDDRRRAFAAALADLDRKGERANVLGSFVGRATMVGVSFLLLVVIGAGAILAVHGVVSAGIVVAFILILLNMGAGAASLAEAIPLLIQGSGGLQRIEELLAERPTVVPPPADGARAVERVRQGIAFEEVGFSYDGRTAALADVSLAIPAGQSVAFVGPSGSGKSTVLNLLLRHYDVDAGRVTIDGIDVRELADESLRGRMAVVSQDNALFQASVRDNIRMGRLDATDAEVEEAARAAEVHDAILALPQGYDTDVGELGARLSGGQRQRVCIARALVRRPDLLLLDEATSALDAANETAINRTLAGLRAGRTTIAVTHRLDQAADMDQIHVLDHGRVAESGTHGALMAADGIYAGLWAKQSGFALSEDGRSATVTAERLAEVPLFAGLDHQRLVAIGTMLQTVRVAAGTVLLKERELEGRFYIIVRGIVDLTVDGPDGRAVPIETLEIGDFLGEIALLEEIPQLATARARTACTLLAMQAQSFLALIADEPALYQRASDVIDRRLQAKLDELVYKRLGMA